MTTLTLAKSKGINSYASYLEARPKAAFRDLGPIIWVALSSVGYGLTVMLYVLVAGKNGNGAVMMACGIAGLLLPAVLIFGFSGLKMLAFLLRHNLLGGRGGAWTLTEDTKLKSFNWWYLSKRLNARHLEAARVLALDFTGDLSELIMVSKNLD